MSRLLTRSLKALQICEGPAAQQCAAHGVKHRRLDKPLPSVPRAPPRTSACQSRQFSLNQPRNASQMGSPTRQEAKKRSTPAMSVKKAKGMQDAIRQGLIPDDLGLLPGTFIMPRGKNLPGWFSNFKGRWQLERKRLGVRFRELAVVLAYRFWAVRPRPKLKILTIPDIAKGLHQEIYSHFAAGDLAPVENKICEGLAGSLRRRIAQLPPNTRLKWTLHKYIGRAELVSYRPGLLPAPKDELRSERNGMVQAVVRIHSLQSLQHIKKVSGRDVTGKMYMKEVLVDRQGRELPESAVEGADAGGVPKDAKETVEYLVVQKSLRVSKEGEWMLWGTAEETTLDKLNREDAEKRRSRDSPVSKAA